MVKDLEAEYRRIQLEFPIIDHNPSVTYDSPVNFNESMRSPRHRWFPYKEGFSPSFVAHFLREFTLSENGNVLDPFAGVGTTLIQAANMGFHAMGFEVSPLAHFIAQTKAQSFSPSEIEGLKKTIRGLKDLETVAPADPPDNKTVVSYFEPGYLEALLKLKAFYLGLSEAQYRDVIKLVYLRLIEPFSTHRKAGNGVKRRTRLLYKAEEGSSVEQVREKALAALNEIVEDLEESPSIKPISLQNASCLLDETYGDETFDTVLTSPPYANCFDYSKIYMCELWLGDFFRSRDDQKAFRLQSVRSHVHSRWPERNVSFGSDLVNEVIFPALASQKLWSKQIPTMLKGYFEDLGCLLQVLKPRMKKGGALGFVVSNSAYGGLPIATDILLSEIASNMGYQIERIEVYRRMVPSSQQFKLRGGNEFFRESLVIFRNQ